MDNDLKSKTVLKLINYVFTINSFMDKYSYHLFSNEYQLYFNFKKYTLLTVHCVNFSSVLCKDVNRYGGQRQCKGLRPLLYTTDVNN